MAEESMKAHEVKRQRLVQRYAKRRAELKATGDYESLQKLQTLPRSSSPMRLCNRYEITEHPKGYVKQFDISRIRFHEIASADLIPGVRKASW